MTAVRLGWITAGTALAAIHCAFVPLSSSFDYAGTPIDYPVVTFVVLELLAGGVYLTLLWLVPRSRPQRGLLVLVLAVGIVMRAAMAVSTPILEDDFYRYLWDGAVLAGGDDPYRFSPAEVLAARARGTEDATLAGLAELAQASGSVAERVNHARLTTVYPPLAQGFFALAAVVEPFDLAAWRALALLADAATLALLYLLLVRLERSPLWLALYWWSPLVVKELVNSAHMDALLLPALTASLLLLVSARRILACLGLAVAAGVKLWPIALLPAALREIAARSVRPGAAVCAGISVFVAAFAGTAWWLAGQAGGESGLGAYAREWRMNDALFLTLEWTVDAVMTGAGLAWIDSASVSRAILAVTLGGLALWLARHAAADAQALCRRFTVVVALVFLLSPAQFPWYYTWVVPFLALTPSPGLVLLGALLPLYYLRFHLAFRGQAELFDHGVVWLEYLPAWLLLAWEWRAGRRRPSPGLAAARP